MGVENDYIVRMIREMIHALALVAFGKKEETVNFDEGLCSMADQGKINGAENQLFGYLDGSEL